MVIKKSEEKRKNGLVGQSAFIPKSKRIGNAKILKRDYINTSLSVFFLTVRFVFFTDNVVIRFCPFGIFRISVRLGGCLETF